MELITPGLGLIFWMTLSFFLLVYVLGKFAWKPILQMLHERETSIHEALNAANQAREDMKELKFSNEQLLQEAKNERDALLNEARKVRDKLLEESRIKASEEASRIVEAAKASIHNEKMAAMTELKIQIAENSLTLARIILQRELEDPRKQEEYVQKLIKEVKFN
ncbi:MAG: F0F1 ATP synthase subunit B [Bacteroidales bacterium]|nr:F0F1 ATP synthase subunit B [Bacteroidales bacterium]